MTRYAIDIGRITVRAGFAATQGELNNLVTRAVQEALADSPLPGGRTARASIEVSTRSIGSAPALAHAIGHAVARAVGGGTRHG